MFAMLGYFLIALPFIAEFILARKILGWKGAFFSFGLAAIIVAIVAVGIHFLALAGIIQAG